MMQDLPELVELLLKSGADPNLTLNHDQYPLFIAISNNHPESVKVLLEHGVRTDLKNSMDQTPLDYVNFLLERGASDAASKSGWQKIKDLLNK
jgi:ankyrin repeat protein